MASSPWLPAAGAAPAPPLEEAAAAAAAAAVTSTAGSAPRSEQLRVEGGGVSAAAAVPLLLQQQQEEEEAKPQLPRDDDSQAETQELEQKIKKYQAILAARLKVKFFSKKAFDGGNIFEAVTVVQGETIQSSRWPCTRSFANPDFFSQDKNSHEKGTPSAATDVSAKNSYAPLATENNITPGKRQQSQKT